MAELNEKLLDLSPRGRRLLEVQLQRAGRLASNGIHRLRKNIQHVWWASPLFTAWAAA